MEILESDMNKNLFFMLDNIQSLETIVILAISVALWISKPHFHGGRVPDMWISIHIGSF